MRLLTANDSDELEDTAESRTFLAVFHAISNNSSRCMPTSFPQVFSALLADRYPTEKKIKTPTNASGLQTQP
jgi:hypothetical protein